jgi:hypothetical protein
MEGHAGLLPELLGVYYDIALGAHRGICVAVPQLTEHHEMVYSILCLALIKSCLYRSDYFKLTVQLKTVLPVVKSKKIRSTRMRHFTQVLSSP